MHQFSRYFFRDWTEWDEDSSQLHAMDFHPSDQSSQVLIGEDDFKEFFHQIILRHCRLAVGTLVCSQLRLLMAELHANTRSVYNFTA